MGDAYCGPAQVRRVLERHRTVNPIFGHALYPPTFPEAAALAKSCGSLHLGITTSQHGYGMIAHAVKTVGAERIPYGSDMPFVSAAGAVGLVLHARISDGAKASIFAGNARRLLGE